MLRPLSLLSLLLALAPAAWAQQAPLQVQPSAAAVEPGDTLAVTVRIGAGAAPVQGLYGVGLQLHFDPAAFEVLDYAPGAFFAPYLGGLSARALELARLEANYFAYAVTFTRPPGLDGAGDVVVLLLRARPDAPGGAYALGLQTVEANTADGTPIPLGLEPGSVTVWGAVVAPPAAPVPSEPAYDARDVAPGVVLRWDSVAGGTAYDLQVAADAAFTRLAAERTDLPDAAWPAEGLAHDTTYYWRVRAHGEGGASEWSPAFRFTTAAAPLVAPATPVPHTPADGAVLTAPSAHLAWHADSLARRYHVQVAADAAFAGLVFEDSTRTAPEADVAGLGGGRAYFWRVRARGDGGTSAWSATAHFSVASQTATETDDGLPGPLDLGSNYPNPFNPETTIAFTLAEAGPVRLEVFDASGRRVATLLNAPRPAGRHAVRWDAGGLASGVYLCRLSAVRQTRTRLLTLQK